MAYPPLLRSAALLGLATGLRTFSSGAALARRRPPGKTRRALLLVALGELVYDKVPSAQGRLKPPSLGARAVSAATAGGRTAGPAGAATATVAAVASAHAGHRARAFAGARGARQAFAAALAEDALAFALAAAGARSR